MTDQELIKKVVQETLLEIGLPIDPLERKEMLRDFDWVRRQRKDAYALTQWTKRSVVGIVVLATLTAVGLGIAAAIRTGTNLLR